MPTPLKHYVWSYKEDQKIRDFFFLVTGIDPKPLYNHRKTKFLFSTDMLRPIEINVLLAGNFKTLKILDAVPKNWKNHYENDIIGCVDFASHLPDPFKYKDRILRVDRQKKLLQLKDRKGLYKSDGITWKRVARLPKKRKLKK